MKSSKKGRKVTLRNDTNIIFVGQPAADITGSQLPTNSQVLKYFFWLKFNTKWSPHDELAYKVLAKVLEFWNQAQLPTMWNENAKKKVMNLWQKWKTLQKHSSRNSETEEKKRKEFQLQLDGLFDIAAPNAEDQIMQDKLRKLEDRKTDVKFLADQRGPRIGIMEGIDMRYAKALKDKEKRHEAKQKREKHEVKRKRKAGLIHSSSSDEVSDESDDDGTAEFQPCKKKAKNSTVIVELPHKIMTCPEITLMADRLKQSSNAATGIVTSVLKAVVLT